MSKIKVFENTEFGSIRTLEIDNKPYFCGSDVASALGYSNVRDAISRHCKGVVKHDTPTSSGIQLMSYIPEGDIYRLIVRSKLPTAERFESWVFDEVLPSIRKHGAYITGQETLSPEEIMARGLKAAESIIQEKQKMIDAQTKVIEESKPKVEYFDAVLSSDGLLNITQIAKEFGKTAVEMNKLLHDLGIQYKAGSCWVPRQNYVDKGYMKSCTRMVVGKTTVQYRWTQKGREFIHRLMARYGYSPVYSGDAITA